MRCPECRQAKPAGQKFCGECGARLASVWSACGAPNPPGQKFCGECGAPLARVPSAAKFGSPEAHHPPTHAGALAARGNPPTAWPANDLRRQPPGPALARSRQ
ncbi:MAG: zinc ribbon domain-containing protein [Candidatus Methylomirabilia bacterium]